MESVPLRLIAALTVMLVGGCTGIVGYQHVRADVGTTEADTGQPYKAAIAHCPNGKMPIAGGYRISDGGGGGGEFPSRNYMIMVNGPEGSNWVVQVRAFGSRPSYNLSAYAVCVDVRQ